MNRKYSLKQNEEIAKLVHFSKIQRKSVGNKYYTVYFLNTEEEMPKVAISISKRFGMAVDRNYEKRVTREILKLNLPLLK